MRFVLTAAIFLAAAAVSPASADEYDEDGGILLEERVVVRAKAVVRRVACIKCRGGGLPWGGLRPVRRAELPWGGLPDYCPPVTSRRVVVVTKG